MTNKTAMNLCKAMYEGRNHLLEEDIEVFVNWLYKEKPEWDILLNEAIRIMLTDGEYIDEDDKLKAISIDSIEELFALWDI